MREFFPLSAKAYDLKSLIIVVLLYIGISAAAGIVLGFLSWIPILGKLISIASQLIDFYSLAGIVVAIMIYFKI